MEGSPVSILLLVSLLLLAITGVGSVLLLSRTGEVRAVLWTALTVALAIPQGISLWQLGWQPAQGLGADLASVAAGAGLFASLFALLSLLALGRTLRELERAETLHWESMEGVRGIAELASRRSMSLDEKLPTLLEMGCERLGLEIGLLSRIRGDRYEVLAIHAPEDFPVSAGAAFALEDTPCRDTIASDRPLALSRPESIRSSARSAFPFEAYLGRSVHLGEEPFGTLVFASLEPRKERFTATHKDLVVLMSEWIGAELERRELLAAGSRTPSGSGESSPHPRRPAAARGLDLNEVVQRLERRLRRAAGPELELVVDLESRLELAEEVRIPLDAVLVSLVRKSAESSSGPAKLVVSTANHEFAREPGILPALAPARYVTLSVSETSGKVDADAFARVFETDAPDTEDPAVGHAEARIPLSTIYRMLQSVGGDLSVEVEPGAGSTFTLFLPRARAASERPGEERPAAAAAPPPVAH
jgi:hypothetical protein